MVAACGFIAEHHNIFTSDISSFMMKDGICPCVSLVSRCSRVGPWGILGKSAATSSEMSVVFDVGTMPLILLTSSRLEVIACGERWSID